MSDLRAQIAEHANATLIKQRRKAKAQWQSVQLADLQYGEVLAFDQTIAKTAWVHVNHTGDGFAILGSGMLKQPPAPDMSGFEDVLSRSTWQAFAIDWVVETCPAKQIVHEMPAAHGHRTDSSLLAALGVRLAALNHHRLVKMIAAQSAKTFLTGHRDAEKGEVKSALLALLGPLDGRWNLDKYDALALAVTSLRKP